MRKCLSAQITKNTDRQALEMINNHFNHKISMKKITKIALASTMFAASISAGSQALAKTEGSYLGIDLLSAKAQHQYANSGSASPYKKFDNSTTGFGLNYKYAFNFNNFFIAPSAFYEKLGTKAVDSDRDNVAINSRYGAKLDFGYDFTDEIALYATAGIASVNYKVDWKSTSEGVSGNKVAPIIGFGASYYPHKNVALSLEYNYQSLDIPTPNFNTPNLKINEAQTKISAVKFGVAYHF